MYVYTCIYFTNTPIVVMIKNHSPIDSNNTFNNQSARISTNTIQPPTALFSKVVARLSTEHRTKAYLWLAFRFTIEHAGYYTCAQCINVC